VTANNAIAYVSPNFNGLTFAAAIVPGEGAETYGVEIDPVCANDDTVPLCAQPTMDTHTGLADAYSVAAMYENNGLYLSAAYESLPDHSTSWSLFGSPFSLPIGQQDKYRLGAGYTMNNLTINGVYEHRVRDFGDVAFWSYDQELEAETDIWQVSAVYTFGNTALKLAYGQGDMSMGIGESWGAGAGNAEDFSGWFGQDGTFESVGAELYGEQDVISVGLEHNLSKRTKVYALYTVQDATFGAKVGSTGDLNNAGNDEYNPADPQFDVGMDGAFDAENSTFSMGMVHTF
jgi:predicted porin